MRILRRFESEHRFFEIVLEYATVSRRTGLLTRDDEDTEPTVMAHASDAAARAAFDEMVAVYVERGYRAARVVDGDDVPHIYARDGEARIAANPELEALCLASPESPEPWGVYADWLMAHGDPRGQLAALHLAGKLDDAKRFLAVHRTMLLGDLAEFVIRELTWRHGFPVGARLRVEDGDGLDDVVRTFLGQPFAQFIRALRFGLADHGSGENDWGPTLEAVIDSRQRSQIRALRFDDYNSDDNELSWTPFGDLSRLGELPGLEHLTIRSGGRGKLGTLELPELRTFVRITGGLAAEEIAAIGSARWPKLEHLEVWLGARDYGAECTIAMLAPILDGAGLPMLRHLGIANTELSNELIPALALSKILPQLRTLDLSRGAMMGRATAALIQHAPAFGHLEAIDLDENRLLPGEIGRIVAALPQTTAVEQRVEDRMDPDDPDYDAAVAADEEEHMRYVAVGE